MNQLELLGNPPKNKRTRSKQNYPLPSQWQLLQQFHVNPQTGDLYFTDLASLTKHVKGTGARNYNFALINTLVAGRKTIAINGYNYYQHRIIFKMMTGSEPHQVDHINGDPTDNRPCNLRAATQSQNQHNRKLNANSRSGYKNVHWSAKRKKWRVQLRRNKQFVVDFLIDDLELAILAAAEARNLYHGQYARHR
jgi:hypothetical protein